MKTKSRLGRASRIGAVVTLSSFALAAQADPFSLQGVCHLTSIIAGQGQCQLEYLLQDGGNPFPVTLRLALVKVDGIVVSQYQNDIANPVMYSAGSVGAVLVSCGATHGITAYITRSPSTVYEKVGALPPIKCPT